MLTANADHHPLMRRMHKLDPRLPPDLQDKRSVIPLAPQVWDAWLAGTPQTAQGLFKVPEESSFAVEIPNKVAPRQVDDAQP
ncbi:MAG: hypothetical protein JSR92_18840 [Proteobacteria bacterium]|nr:hypothetical protein [Pseudomonadota bacterium]